MYISIARVFIVEILMAALSMQVATVKNRVLQFNKNTNGVTGLTQLGQFMSASLISCIDRCLIVYQERCYVVSYNKAARRCTAGGLMGYRSWPPAGQEIMLYRKTACDGYQFKLYTLPNGMSCLWVSTDQVNYHQAKTTCANNHSHLITLKERFKIDALKAAVHGRTGPFWIGLDDINTEGQFKWIDGPALTSALRSIIFAKNQPDNQGDEDCVTYGDQVDFFNDEKCDKNEHYVCEINL